MYSPVKITTTGIMANPSFMALDNPPFFVVGAAVDVASGVELVAAMAEFDIRGVGSTVSCMIFVAVAVASSFSVEVESKSARRISIRCVGLMVALCRCAQYSAM